MRTAINWAVLIFALIFSSCMTVTTKRIDDRMALCERRVKDLDRRVMDLEVDITLLMNTPPADEE